MNERPLSWFAVAIACIWLIGGCSQRPATEALDGVATESGTLGVGSQRTLLSLYSLGMNPCSPIASPTLQGDSVTPSNMIQVSGGTRPSYYYIETYEADDDAKLADIQQKLQKLQAAIIKLVNARIDLAREQVKMAMVRGTAAAEVLTSAERETRDNALRASIADAEQKVRDAEGAAADAEEEAQEALAHKNVLLVQWNASSEAGGSASLASRASVSARRSTSADGYALLRGVRRIRLVAGTDLAKLNPRGADGNFGANALMRRPKQFTFITQVQEIAYLSTSTLSEVVAASVKGKIQDFIGGLDFDEIKTLEIQIQLDASRLERLSNSGSLSGPKVKILSVPGLDPYPIADEVDGRLQDGTHPQPPAKAKLAPYLTLNDMSDWITIHAVATSYNVVPTERTASTATATASE